MHVASQGSCMFTLCYRTLMGQILAQIIKDHAKEDFHNVSGQSKFKRSRNEENNSK